MSTHAFCFLPNPVIRIRRQTLRSLKAGACDASYRKVQAVVHAPVVSRRTIVILLLIGTSLMLCPSACTMPQRSSDPNAARATPRLASSGSETITLFGDLPTPDRDFSDWDAQVAIQRHTFAEDGEDSDPDIDPSGQWIVFASTRHEEAPNLYVQRTDGVAVRQLTNDAASEVQPAFSPDGQRIAFASNRAGDWDIWVIHIDGTNAVQVTSGPGDDLHPSWSPDGQRLVYCRRGPQDGSWGLWIVNATAGGGRQFIGNGLFPEWSPKGDVIAYQRARQRGSRWFSLWTLTLVEGEPRFPTEIAASGDVAMITPTFSPDGRMLAYTAMRSAPTLETGSTSGSISSDIWIVSLDGRGRRCMTDGYGRHHSPVFGPDGRLYFISDRDGASRVWSVSPGGTSGLNPSKLASHPEPTGDDDHDAHVVHVEPPDAAKVIEASHGKSSHEH